MKRQSWWAARVHLEFLSLLVALVPILNAADAGQELDLRRYAAGEVGNSSTSITATKDF